MIAAPTTINSTTTTTTKKTHSAVFKVQSARGAPAGLPANNSSQKTAAACKTNHVQSMSSCAILLDSKTKNNEKMMMISSSDLNSNQTSTRNNNAGMINRDIVFLVDSSQQHRSAFEAAGSNTKNTKPVVVSKKIKSLQNPSQIVISKPSKSVQPMSIKQAHQHFSAVNFDVDDLTISNNKEANVRSAESARVKQQQQQEQQNSAQSVVVNHFKKYSMDLRAISKGMVMGGAPPCCSQSEEDDDQSSSQVVRGVTPTRSQSAFQGGSCKDGSEKRRMIAAAATNNHHNRNQCKSFIVQRHADVTTQQQHKQGKQQHKSMRLEQLQDKLKRQCVRHATNGRSASMLDFAVLNLDKQSQQINAISSQGVSAENFKGQQQQVQMTAQKGPIVSKISQAQPLNSAAGALFESSSSYTQFQQQPYAGTADIPTGLDVKSACHHNSAHSIPNSKRAEALQKANNFQQHQDITTKVKQINLTSNDRSHEAELEDLSSFKTKVSSFQPSQQLQASSSSRNHHQHHQPNFSSKQPPTTDNSSGGDGITNKNKSSHYYYYYQQKQHPPQQPYIGAKNQQQTATANTTTVKQKTSSRKQRKQQCAAASSKIIVTHSPISKGDHQAAPSQQAVQQKGVRQMQDQDQEQQQQQQNEKISKMFDKISQIQLNLALIGREYEQIRTIQQQQKQDDQLSEHHYHHRDAVTEDQKGAMIKVEQQQEDECETGRSLETVAMLQESINLSSATKPPQALKGAADQQEWQARDSLSLDSFQVFVQGQAAAGQSEIFTNHAAVITDSCYQNDDSSVLKTIEDQPSVSDCFDSAATKHQAQLVNSADNEKNSRSSSSPSSSPMMILARQQPKARQVSSTIGPKLNKQSSTMAKKQNNAVDHHHPSQMAVKYNSTHQNDTDAHQQALFQSQSSSGGQVLVKSAAKLEKRVRIRKSQLEARERQIQQRQQEVAVSNASQDGFVADKLRSQPRTSAALNDYH